MVFVREFVPSRVVSRIARSVYNEPYHPARFATERAQSEAGFSVTHRLRACGRWHTAGITVRAEAALPPADSLQTFLKEQTWGFGRSRSGNLLRYRVEHPLWRTYPVEGWNLDVAFPDLYGPRWAFLNGAAPINVLCAEGSAVRVYPRG